MNFGVAQQEDTVTMTVDLKTEDLELRIKRCLFIDGTGVARKRLQHWGGLKQRHTTQRPISVPQQKAISTKSTRSDAENLNLYFG
ncbi:hypothetical protein PROFUN_04045 [Planoprotostelium fungivorum]|uniref:Uncharacterized protein n=1 Tax=Planoprotostelium fungivorum TaxID=1890364 RepID=A0A2P6NW81_9EUKA|nr:hypothetical protein PROFUN_04045 [Planoprotostelium fungivorum]